MTDVNESPPVRRRRRITGMTAVLLPFTEAAEIDWPTFDALVSRTVDAGLVPAVNMDTGFGPVLGPDDRRRVIEVTAGIATAGVGRHDIRFVAGAHVADQPGATLDLDTYSAECAGIAAAGGTPIVFPSHGLAAVDEPTWVDAHRHLAGTVDRLLGFELGRMFHPAGRIPSLEAFAALLEVPQVVGLKHSSLRRDLEWQRLALRDERRPDFLALTGNDRAIDLVTVGSDYLLGLAAFAPDAFALRDAAWADGDDARFWELNDLLQYLGQFAFRAPVPGYRHDAAMFLRRRGWIRSERTHPTSPTRSVADGEVLDEILERLDVLLTG